MKLKYTIFALCAATATAFAGTPSIAPEPAPAPTLTQWFVGGSFGQINTDGTSNYDGSDITLGDVADFDLDSVAVWEDPTYNGNTGANTLGDYFDSITGNNWSPDAPLLQSIANFNQGFANQLSFRTEISDVDLNMYSLHFGRVVGNAGGFDLAAYLEVAWMTGDFNATGILRNIPEGTDLVLFSQKFDIDIVPVTLNFKAEHTLFGPVGAYISGGLGYAWTNISGDGYDESGGGFFAQAAAGLVWNVSESIDIYGGARWVYLDSLDYGNDSLGFELDDQLGWEIGLRYKF